MSDQSPSTTALLLFAIVGACLSACATPAGNRPSVNQIASTSSADCAAGTAAAIDHRTGPALSDQTRRCVNRGEIYDTGHSGDIGTALRQSVPIIQ